MIAEDYISFETAKLLKKKGFKSDNCHTAYDENGSFFWYGDYSQDRKAIMDAPTLQMAMKWLREVHNIHISIYVFNRDLPVGDKALYTCDIATKEQSSKDGHLRLASDTYEEACEAAIKYCLENLI